MQKYCVNSIGVVRNEIDAGCVPDDWSPVISDIRIYKRYKKALEGLDRIKKVLVVFRFHLANSTKLYLHPRGDRTRPKRGVFATRSQFRPNRLGVTEVELISVRGNTVRVRGLDAFNGTPVIDIKPADH